MKNALVTFVVLLALLGLGTILVVENYSGEQILPRNIKGFSVGEIGRSYERGQRAFRRWWNRATDKIPELSSPATTPLQNSNESEKKIVKWQDAQGVWHYEYAVPGQNESPASPP